jgi:hypothetical protein
MVDNSILFLHDINKGPFCNLGKFLNKEYDSTNPDLQVRDFKKNSFLKNFLTDIYFHLPLFFLALFSYIVYLKVSSIYGIIMFFVALLLIILIGRSTYIRRAVTKSLEENIYLAEKLIKKNNPDILIGHGWGASIIINLIQRNIWTGNAILIAPSFYKINRMINKNKNSIEEFRLIDFKDYEGKLIIYHSKLDRIVPYSDTKKLCESKLGLGCQPDIDIDLILLDRGDHDLDILIQENEPNLRNDISSLRKGAITIKSSSQSSYSILNNLTNNNTQAVNTTIKDNEEEIVEYCAPQENTQEIVECCAPEEIVECGVPKEIVEEIVECGLEEIKEEIVECGAPEENANYESSILDSEANLNTGKWNWNFDDEESYN